MTYTDLLLTANSILILVIGVLSSLIAFFLKGLYRELKSLVIKVNDLSEATNIKQAVEKSRLDQVSQRLNRVEAHVLNPNTGRKAK